MATLIFNGAAEQVTGSCFLLSTDSGRVLFDCGMFQGDGDESEERNEQPFPFDAKGIDAVVLTHAHLDHSGRLPLLARRGFTGPVYATRATHDLLEVMLKDAAFLEQKDAEWENRRRERAGKPPIEPTFTIEDVEAILSQRRPLEYHQEQTLLPDLKVYLVNAGHILGAASAVADVGKPGNSRRLVVSGDLGNHCSPLMRDPEPIHEADVVLMESTYGDRDHKPLNDTLEEFEQILEAAADNGGNVIIPSFAVERAQDLIYWLGRFWRDGKLNRHQVFLDSPMAIQASEIYEQHHQLFNHDDPEFLKVVAQGWQAWLPILRYTRHTEQSMMLNNIQSGAVIIAGSGMCTGGRVRHHLKHNLWKHKSHVVIVGYQARGTLGRRLVDGAERVRLYGQDIAVKAEIHTLGGFSAHAGQQQLVDWANQFRDANPQFHLVHGEPEALCALSERLEKDGLKVAVATEDQRIDI
jgi:metallo-beta-lactamase family protein